MDKKKVKLAFVRMLSDQGYTHAITLKPNDHGFGRSCEALHRLFVKVHMLVDRALLGSRFNLPNRAPLRSLAVGIVEGLPHTGHVHGAFRIAEPHWEKFESLFADGSSKGGRHGIWRTLVPNGTSEVVRITSAEGWHNYSLKNVWEVNDSDRMLFLPFPVGEAVG